MKHAIPFLRYIARADHFTNREPTMAYDCRLLYILSGEGELWTEQGTFALQPDTLAYYPSGIRYLPRAAADTALEFITINFDFTLQHEDVREVQLPVQPQQYEAERELATQAAVATPLFGGPFAISGASFLKDTLL